MPSPACANCASAAAGLTNPLRFEVGTLTEVREREPNEPQANARRRPVAAVPCTFNGQIQSGDVDVFRFHARRGQNLVVRGEARALDSLSGGRGARLVPDGGGGARCEGPGTGVWR